MLQIPATLLLSKHQIPTILEPLGIAHGLLNHLAPVQLTVGRDSATGMKY